tara:strand:+ start:6383 stop:6562 length:180 start_codon:yes stop_codon:yes gene_type:complete
METDPRDIMNYDILDNASASSLVDEVQEKIKEGWSPIGESYFANSAYHQTIIFIRKRGT